MKPFEKWMFLLLVVIGVALGAYRFIEWHREVVTEVSEETARQERERWEREVAQMQADLAALQRKEVRAEPEAPQAEPSEAYDRELFLPDRKDRASCEDLKHQVLTVFAYVETREYLPHPHLEQNVRGFYNAVMATLAQNPPIASELLLDFDALLQNVLHFYRVLGKKNVHVIRNLLAREDRNLEMILNVFFEYFRACEASRDEEIFVPPFAVQYEYAAFFLNTLGGRSYLFRRNSHLRILVTYYAVLVLHEANEKILNRHGIDIRPHLYRVIEEIEARTDLSLQKNYLGKLSSISKRYPALEGSFQERP
ncbi:MAG: hypothetical protein JXD19_07380 [Deltaproteobacteria bacterium]|nr:hypothetical protein [Deltaproteobacteria bacterium]